MSDGVHPGRGGAAVTYSDTTPMKETRGLWVGAAGDVYVDFAGPNADKNVAFKGVQAGTLLPLCVIRVRTGTTVTAGNITAIY